jgi:pantoate--beta-alanine ligase
VTGVPTVREPDGLALSSRNKRLSAEERQRATVLYRALSAAESSYDRGERKTARLIEAALEALTREPEIRVEYLEVVDAVEMQPVDEVKGPARMAVAAWLGDTRLIDNVPLGQVPAR